MFINDKAKPKQYAFKSISQRWINLMENQLKKFDNENGKLSDSDQIKNLRNAKICHRKLNQLQDRNSCDANEFQVLGNEL